jgi:predicted nucleic acid-binding protein
MKRYVIDTSVVVKWFSSYDEGDLDHALHLRRQFAEGECSMIVPDLLFYELANALRFNPRFTPADVRRAVGSVIGMGFVVREASLEMLSLAVETAYDRGATVYDACFAAVAQMENGALVTADDRLYTRFKRLKNITHLRDWRPEL